MSEPDRNKPVLVYLANGVRGGAIVHALARDGRTVRALVRDTGKARTLLRPGVMPVRGDFADPASLQAASTGAGSLILQIPTGAEAQMRTWAEAAIAAARAGGITTILLVLASASRPAPCPEPSLVANAMLEALVRESGLQCAVIWPTMYLDNLLKPSARTEIVRDGIFAPPIAAEQKIAWTSASDMGAAIALLLHHPLAGSEHRIAGPASLDGNALAAAVAEGLGKPVAYRAQTIGDFERDVDAAMGAGNGRRIASKFRYFASHPDEARAILSEPHRPQPGLEDFRPTGVAAWVRQNRAAFLGSADLGAS